jgi:hypothetical protein
VALAPERKQQRDGDAVCRLLTQGKHFSCQIMYTQCGGFSERSREISCQMFVMCTIRKHTAYTLFTVCISMKRGRDVYRKEFSVLKWRINIWGTPYNS